MQCCYLYGVVLVVCSFVWQPAVASSGCKCEFLDNILNCGLDNLALDRKSIFFLSKIVKNIKKQNLTP